MSFILVFFFSAAFSCNSDSSDIGCNGTCVGPQSSSCETLLTGAETQLSSTTMLELSFSTPTTITGVSIVFAGDSDTPKWVRIGQTGTDTSIASYEGSASYSIVALESTVNISETMDLIQEDLYVDSNSWMVEISVANGATVVLDSIVIRGGAAPLFSEWGDWGDCDCGQQSRARTCYSDSTDICAAYSTESESCGECTCELNSNMFCSTYNDETTGECDKLMDSDATTVWSYDFSDSTTLKNVIFEFRNDVGENVVYTVESFSWNLTLDTDIDGIEWRLITPVYPDASLTSGSVVMSYLGPFSLVSHVALWSLGNGKDTQILWFQFFSSNDTQIQRLGINGINVKGYRSEECDPNDWVQESGTVTFPMSAIIVSTIGIFITMCLASWWCHCGCFKKKMIEARMSTRRTLSELKVMYEGGSIRRPQQSALVLESDTDSGEGEEGRVPPNYQDWNTPDVYMANLGSGGQIMEEKRPRARILTSLKGEKHVFRPETYNCYEALLAWVEETYLELTEGNWFLQLMDSERLISSDKCLSDELVKAEGDGRTKLRILINPTKVVV